MSSAQEIIAAYPVAVPERQTQTLPGLDKRMNPHLEYTKLEVWDDNGKPSLVEYTGSGKLLGKTAIITGGDNGIGRAAAIMFAREGASGITIAHLPEELEDAKDAKKMIEDSGAMCDAVLANLMDDFTCQKLVENHILSFGKLDILVNNASKQIMNKQNFAEIDLRIVESTFRSNILQMFAITKYALPHLKRGSSIINTTSATAYRGSARLVDYKGAILTFTRSLALQLMPKGIRVNAVAPGPIVTALQAGSRSEENMEGWGVGTPLHGRAGQPAEVGPSYVFLASRDSNIMTGQVIHVNSGEHIGGS
ncbi:unnamed protein product [Cyclocybe aegerita]|uniref:NAD(P)-binding protein n=1 Tax=Cyclocybe aegerita TaxID=1973307 RepID=A0A8S0WKU8_CYCAE|nr:unnamed protein product [Cyclocybe aegerita]